MKLQVLSPIVMYTRVYYELFVNLYVQVDKDANHTHYTDLCDD